MKEPQTNNQTTERYIEIEIGSLRNAIKDIQFDIFLKLSENNIIHVFSRATGLDYQRLAQYIQKGVTHLHIRAEDEKVFKSYLAKSPLNIIEDPNTPREKKIAALLNMTEQNMAEIFHQIEVRDETATQAKQLIRNYVSLMSSAPDTLAMILKLVSHGDYLYFHSIAVSVFSMLIAKATGHFTQNALEQIALGAFLHDIGYTQISKEALSTPGEPTPELWREIKSHPAVGLRMLENTSVIPKEVKYIIYQHHEQPGGLGYPNSLHSTVIYYPAKVVAIADGFSAMISKRPFRPAYTAEEALKTIRNEPGKYDSNLFEVVNSIFSRVHTEE